MTSILFRCLLITFALMFCSKLVLSTDIQSTHDMIYESFKTDTKQLFKVWHYLNNKEYDYNTAEGVKKYKTFKTNLAEINKHNASGASWTMGINHLSDMSWDEVKAYYNIKTIATKAVSRGLRALNSFNLDDYEDDDDDTSKTANVNGATYTAVDWTGNMEEVRHQKSCGSCWAFTTHSVIEGHFNIKNQNKSGWASTQHSVDCDKSNHGCNGGWYTGAFDFISKNKAFKDASYPYTAKAGVCKAISGDFYQITGANSFDVRNRRNTFTFDQLLQKGPVAVAVDCNSKWQSYRGGILNVACATSINHAVTVVGYSPAQGTIPAYFVVRNSWGATWGEKGHVRVQQGSGLSQNACNIENIGFGPSGFK